MRNLLDPDPVGENVKKIVKNSAANMPGSGAASGSHGG